MFAHHIPKQYIKNFHQVGIIVWYKSICQTLNAIALAVKEVFQEKATKKRFFIFYDIMNIYEKAYNQQLYNRSARLSYNTGYVCFINTSRSLDNSNDNWYEHYINTNQLDRETVNDIELDNLELNSIALNHQSATICHIASKMLGKYFG